MKVGGRGKQRQRGGPDNSHRRRPESGPSRPLTKSSHCWALVVEKYLEQTSRTTLASTSYRTMQGTLSGKAPGDRSTASSQPRPSPCTEAPHLNSGRGSPEAPGTRQPPMPLPCPLGYTTRGEDHTGGHRGAHRSSLPQLPTLCKSASSRLPKPSPQGPVTAIRLSHSVARGMRRPYVRRLVRCPHTQEWCLQG